MLVVRFEWDPQKAAANLRAHRISFAEAATVLEDAFALTRESDEAKLLVVVYAYREPDRLRVISAWKASNRQREPYEKGRS